MENCIYIDMGDSIYALVTALVSKILSEISMYYCEMNNNTSMNVKEMKCSGIKLIVCLCLIKWLE